MLGNFLRKLRRNLNRLNDYLFMIETHAFGNFVPENAKYLILGSFTARQAFKENRSYNKSYDWFYSNKRNQFWFILEKVYEQQLENKQEKQKLFSNLCIAIADIILQCERKENNNLDKNLINSVYNIDAITKILDQNKIKKIFFTSCFVEKKFKQIFKDVLNSYKEIEMIALPSPSPRFARMNKQQKIRKYKELLPNLNLDQQI